jgi:hypothetical protein
MGHPWAVDRSLLHRKEAMFVHHSKIGSSMSALGHKRTLKLIRLMSALPPKADIDHDASNVALCQKQTSGDLIQLLHPRVIAWKQVQRGRALLPSRD